MPKKQKHNGKKHDRTHGYQPNSDQMIQTARQRGGLVCYGKGDHVKIIGPQGGLAIFPVRKDMCKGTFQSAVKMLVLIGLGVLVVLILAACSR